MNLQLHLSVTWPVLAPALGAVLVLLLDVLWRSAPRWVPLSVAGLALAGGAVATIPGLTQAGTDRRGAFCLPDGECLYAAGTLSSGLQLLALLSAGIVLALAWQDWGHRSRGVGGTAIQSALMLAATAGVAAVPASRDLASLLVALELATLPTVALVALERRREREGRAVAGAVALLTTSLVSFALLALGAALWVTATGTAVLSRSAAADALAGDQVAGVLVLAVVLLVSGIGFKLSTAPFHAWTPLTYRAAPMPVTVYLAGASKVAAAGALVVLIQALAGLSQFTLIAVAVLAAVSMTLGNVMALRQQHLVTLMAWSAVAQAGWVMLPLAAASSRAAQAAVGYLTVYVVATLLVFAVLLGTVRSLGAPTLERHRGLMRTHPVLAAVLGFALLALAGLPPAVVGLVAKVVALRPVAGEGMWWLAVVAALNVALGIAVYLRWMAALLDRSPVSAEGAEPAAIADDTGRGDSWHDDTKYDDTGHDDTGYAGESDPTTAAAGETGSTVPRREALLPWPHRVVVTVLTAALVFGSIAPIGIW